MNLPDYIQKVGYDEAARVFEVKRRTVEAWRRGERRPRPAQANIIVARSPVTYEGIYGSGAKPAA